MAELLKTWELPNLIPIFEEQQITVQALSALTHEDLKDLIPQTGPRVLFTRCWRTWKKEFLPTGSDSTYNISSFSDLDFSNVQIDLELQNDCESNSKDSSQLVVIPLKDCESETQIGKQNTPILLQKENNNETVSTLDSQSGLIIDFEEIHKDHSNNLFAFFPLARIKIMEILQKRNSKDSFCQELICQCESSEEEKKNLGALLAIPHLLNTTTIKQKKKKGKQAAGCSWKPSKAETRDVVQSL